MSIDSDSPKIVDNVRSNVSDSRFTSADGRIFEIRDVWMYNLEEEMANIRNIIETHPYVAMVFRINSLALCNLLF